MTTLPVKINMLSSLRDLASKSIGDDVQEQLGRIQSIINSFDKTELPSLYEDSLNIAIAALSTNPPNTLLCCLDICSRFQSLSSVYVVWWSRVSYLDSIWHFGRIGEYINPY
jgi:hypothetical protein